MTMIDIYELSEENPWWKNPDEINNDLHIKKFDASSIQWIPRIKDYIKLDVEDYILYTIRGPRQVGKTTLLKLLIRERLESKISPLRIFYWTCDLVPSPQKLEEIIQSFISYAVSQTKERLYIFIDEINAVRNWQNAIKSLWNKGMLKNISIIVCGSHAMDIKAGADKLPGRTGKGDYVKNQETQVKVVQIYIFLMN